MDYLDTLIPVAVLGAVGVFVVFLMRRIAREQDAEPRAADSAMEAQPEPAKIDEPTSGRLESALAAAPQPTVPMPVVPGAKKARKRAPIPAVPTPSVQTPIVKVMGLLQEKDSLAAAFLLREILAPPVSRRHK